MIGYDFCKSPCFLGGANGSFVSLSVGENILHLACLAAAGTAFYKRIIVELTEKRSSYQCSRPSLRRCLLFICPRVAELMILLLPNGRMLLLFIFIDIYFISAHQQLKVMNS